MTTAMKIDNNNIQINPVTDKIDSIQLGGWLSFFVLTGFLYYGSK
jgi:hypothetical protein